MRWGKLLLAVLCAALFLLLLSALVVAPEAEAPAPDTVPMTGLRLLPLALPAQGADGAQPPRQPSPRASMIALFCALTALPALRKVRDANGRVLCAKRYENSFYQVFHPEVAGG